MPPSIIHCKGKLLINSIRYCNRKR